MTGGRLKRIEQYIKDEDAFCFTYGDGVSDINITKLIEFHKKQKVKATLAATLSPGRFGNLSLQGNMINSFKEKPVDTNSLINGGFFVLSPSVIDYIEHDKVVWEGFPLEELAKQGQLAAYQHLTFWQCMDTLRDKKYLEELWLTGKAPWKVW